jgi:hypothetical protein
MNNKLNSFNKDKIKCKKCKEYFDEVVYFHTWGIKIRLCEDCHKKWIQVPVTATTHVFYTKDLEDWCNK